MKKFIYTLSVFCIGLFGLAIAADFVISQRLRTSKSWMLMVWNEIYAGNLQSDVLVMGACRALFQYSPHVLDSILDVNSHNIGIDGRQINSQIIRYDAYRRNNVKPKLIIQNIDLNTLYLGSSRPYEREQFFPYFFDTHLKKAVSKYEEYSFLEKYLPVYRYIGYKDFIQIGFGIKKINSSPGYDYKIKGFGPSDRPWDGSYLEQHDEFHYGEDLIAIRLFDNYLAKAYAENIRVIFVYAPIYIEVTNRMVDLEGMYQMYDSIAGKYNIPVLDYTFDPMSYDTTFFFEPVNLNRTGAELFSVKLAHDIDSLLKFGWQ